MDLRDATDALERRVLDRLGDVMIPPGPRLPGWTTGARERFFAYLDAIPPELAMVLRAALWGVELGAVAVHGRPASTLDDATRLAWLNRLADAPWPVRLPFRGLSVAMKVVAFDDPAAFQALDIPYRKPEVRDEAMPRWAERATDGREPGEDVVLEAEVVVVGTGAGGAAAACTLAERGRAVVMLEEGDWNRRPSFTGRPLEMQHRMYRDGGSTRTVGRPSILVPTGCTVGGTTTVNSGTCFRPPARTLRRWQDRHGLRGWTAESLAPFLDRVESVYQVAPTRREVAGALAEVIARGAEALGWDHGPLSRCAPECDGQGVCAFGCPSGAKRTADVGFVPRALRQGARLWAGTRVDRLLVRGGRVAGVEARTSSGRRVTVHAQAVVLAMGTLRTPLFLMRHRIGNASGQLGRNLSLHPAGGVSARVDERLEAWRCVPQGWRVDRFQDEGILLEGFHVPLDLHGMLLREVGPAFRDAVDEYDRTAMFGFMVEDDTRGRVLPGPGGRPIVLYDLCDADVRRVVRATEVLCRIYLAAGARRIRTAIHGWSPIDDTAGLDACLARPVRALDLELGAYHPLGTCHMGDHPSRSVCDPDGRVWGVGGLIVADGAAVPPALGVNPMITISAVAMRNAEALHSALG